MISRLGWGSVTLALLVTVMALASQASAGCAACGADVSAQQDAWNKDITKFMEGESGVSEEETSSEGVISAKSSRQQLSSETGSDQSSESDPSSETKSDASAEAPPDPSAVSTVGTVSTSGDPDVAPEGASADYRAPEQSSHASPLFAPLSEVGNADVILDISPNATEYVDGAVNVPYTQFLKDGKLKPLSELARVLGNAGISRDDSVVIYGECQPCGGGPSAATYVYWVFKYLGHENVRLMDGTIDDWVAANLPTETSPKALGSTVYIPALKPNLLATYDYVRNGGAQIVDARTPLEYDGGTILQALNLPYDEVLDGKRIKDDAALTEIFSGLSKEVPVVVFTNTGVKASMVWFALETQGYDARLYTWQDWLANQPVLNISLVSASAEPNPAKAGDAVNVTAVFGEGKPKAKASNETLLTTKGCATCGFGSPQGFANIDTSTGVAELGGTKSQGQGQVSLTPQGGFTCIASIRDSAGGLLDRVTLHRVSDDVYSGTWNANVAGGLYDVTLVASAAGATKTFQNVLEIEVI